MLPKIAFFGRPNVGKSSIVNRLLGDRIQIVSNIAGTTVDLVYRTWKTSSGEIFLVDTVGVESVKDLRAAFDAVRPDLSVLVADCSSGILPIEYDFRKFLLSTRVPLLCVMNKSDLSKHSEPELPNCLKISAKTGFGMKQFAEALQTLIRAKKTPESEIDFRLALVGRTNVGKSSLFNTLAAREISRVSPEPHTTRDFLELAIKRKGMRIILMDCAGFKKGLPRNKIEAYVEERTERAIKLSDIVAVVLSVEDGITNFDRRLVSRVVNAGKPFLVVFNKWDLATDEIKKEFSKKGWIESVLPAFSPVVFTSAVTKKSVWQILDLAEAIVREFRDSSKINLIREICIEISRSNPPPFRGNKPNLLKQVDVKITPRLVISLKFTFPDLVKQNYLRHFEKLIRQRVPLRGIPFKLELVKV